MIVYVLLSFVCLEVVYIINCDFLMLLFFTNYLSGMSAGYLASWRTHEETVGQKAVQEQ